MVDFIDTSKRVGFGYEAVENTGRRKRKSAGQKPHADQVLKLPDRKIGENATQDLLENMALAGWMIRRHLDATTKFHFEVGYDLPEPLWTKLDGLLKWHGKKENFDAARRHSRNQAMRLFELAKVIDGDALFNKINRRSSPRYGSLQLVEGTLIKKPKDLPPSLTGMRVDGTPIVTDLGLQLDEFGGTRAYIVCKYDPRNKTSLVYDRRIRDIDAIYDGYFDRYSQTRGHSPLLAAVNSLLDVKESKEYQLLKIKVHALFGYFIKQQMVDDMAGDGLPSSVPDLDGDENDGGEDIYVEQREVDFSEGPQALNLDPGEDVGMIESSTPPSTVKDFTELCIRCALLALDIPYSMFDGRGSTFAHTIADQKLYTLAVESKREANQNVMEQYVDWKVAQWLSDGMFDGYGMSDYTMIRDAVHVLPAPTPWLDRMNEVNAAEREVALGLKSIPQLARERGVDAFEVLKQQKEYLDKADAMGVPIFIGVPGAKSERDNRLDNEIKESENEAIDNENSTSITDSESSESTENE